jgi:uncharacterized protein (TIGR03435 family)
MQWRCRLRTDTAVVSVVVALASIGAVSAQAQQARAIAFEVAAIKRNASDDTRTTYRLPPSGIVSITNASVRMLVARAYEIEPMMERFTLLVPQDHPLFRGANTPLEYSTGPRFDVQAKIPDGAPSGQQYAMLRTLLAERFKLRVHKVTRSLPVYALTVAREGRLGPSLRPSSVDCAAYRVERAKNPGTQQPQSLDGRPLCLSEYSFGPTMGMQSAGAISSLIRMLQGQVDRPVVDATGLEGSYEWAVSFALTGAANSDAATIYTAVQEQLGLKFEPRTAPYEVLVIDSVEMPSEN